MTRFTARQIKNRIYLCGIKEVGYRVITSNFAGMDEEVRVGDFAVGNALVHLLRDWATSEPQLFPESRP